MRFDFSVIIFDTPEDIKCPNCGYNGGDENEDFGFSMPCIAVDGTLFITCKKCRYKFYFNLKDYKGEDL